MLQNLNYLALGEIKASGSGILSWFQENGKVAIIIVMICVGIKWFGKGNIGKSLLVIAVGMVMLYFFGNPEKLVDFIGSFVDNFLNGGE